MNVLGRNEPIFKVLVDWIKLVQTGIFCAYPDETLVVLTELANALSTD